MPHIDKKIKSLGITLPSVPPPLGSYVPAVRTGNLVFTSGNDCRIDGEFMYIGKVGSDLTIKEGYKASRQTMINLLAVLRSEIGNLSRIKKVVKLLAFVNSSDGFSEQPDVINGASDLLNEIFGEKGVHARSAIGTSELPFNIPVEIEIIVELYD